MSKFEKMDQIENQRSELDKTLEVSSPEGFTEWLIAAHGLHEGSRDMVIINLKEAFKKQHRKGQLIPLNGISLEIHVFGLRIVTIKG